MLDERSVQTVSTPFNTFKNKGNVEVMLNESLSQFKFDSTFNNVERRTCLNAPDVCFNKVLNAS